MNHLTATAFTLLALNECRDGAGLSLAAITRFISSRTPAVISEYRVEKLLHTLVGAGSVNVDVDVSAGGRISRRYTIVGAGFLLLLAYAHTLPKRERIAVYTEFAPTYERINAIVQSRQEGN